MKVLVAVKRVPDPNAYLPLGSDGQFNLTGIRHVVNPWDEIALDRAAEAKVTERVSEVIAVSVGPTEGEDILRAALARGADRAILVEESDPNPQTIAQRLAEIARREEPDLILCGKLASDSDDGQTGGRLAGILGRPLVVGATEIALPEMAGKVVLFDLRGRDPKPIPLPAILKARSKPLERVCLEPSLPGSEDGWRIIGYSVPSPRPPCRFVRDVDELVAELQTVSGGQREAGVFDLPEPRSSTLWLGNEEEAASLGVVAGKRGWPLVRGVRSVEQKEGWLHCKRYVHSGRFVEEIAVSALQNAILIAPDAVRSDSDRKRVADLIAEQASPVMQSEESQETQTNLRTARVVVAGGRGLRDAGTFKRLVGGLAEALSGAVAASGGASNTGIAPAHLVIGQSGKSVAPDLYVALGISGADQHVAGFKDAKTVVAINSDPDAPIFRFADIGLVADLNTTVPEWIARAGK